MDALRSEGVSRAFIASEGRSVKMRRRVGGMLGDGHVAGKKGRGGGGAGRDRQRAVRASSGSNWEGMHHRRREGKKEIREERGKKRAAVAMKSILPEMSHGGGAERVGFLFDFASQ